MATAVPEAEVLTAVAQVLEIVPAVREAISAT